MENRKLTPAETVALREARYQSGGYYLSRASVALKLYRLNMATSSTLPSRLTGEGLLARETAMRGQTPKVGEYR